VASEHLSRDFDGMRRTVNPEGVLRAAPTRAPAVPDPGLRAGFVIRDIHRGPRALLAAPIPGSINRGVVGPPRARQFAERG
jgi:hypothetical protein